MPDASGRVRVLHLITQLCVGGAQENTFLTVGGLDRNQFEVDLAGGPGGNWEERARAVADRVFLLPSMSRGIHVVKNARAFLEIVTLLKKHRYHILHTHSSNAGILGCLAGRFVAVPIIIHTYHGFSFNDLTLPRVIRRLLLWLERLAAWSCDQLITVSELNKTEAVQKRIAPAHKLVTVHSGIDLEQFKAPVDVNAMRARLGLNGGWPVVGMVGRLTECNGPEVFVDAALQVLKVRPRVYFLLVGDGPSRSRVEALAEGVPQIKFLGYRSDIPQILQTFDVFVFPARWAGLGRALTEAMISGRAIVASAVNGVPEIVHHGDTGLLVPANDAEAFAKEICYLLENPIAAKELGQRGQELVIPEFSAELMVHRITDLYENLLAPLHSS